MENYLKPIFEELCLSDGLCVMAKGIGIERLFVKFIKSYSCCSISSSSAGQGVVFCLNALEEEKWIHDELYADGVQQIDFPKTILGDVVGQDRGALYQQGGCFIATSRVIIHDLLRRIVHPSRIRGFLVFNAHKISDSSIESFILRVYKNGNRNGFIKAFTDNPDALCRGFGQLESLMQLLYVQKLFLWPRFHSLIQSALSPSSTSSTSSPSTRKKFEVIELTIPLSSKMSTVQAAILSATETCINELKRGTPQLDPTLLTLENGLFYSFDTAIRTQLEPEWHRLSQRTKQLIADLTTLRQLLDHLIRYDAITFHSFLLSVRTSGLSQTSSPSLWLTSAIANTLFRCSRDRVLELREIPPMPSSDPSTEESTKSLEPELSPLLSLPSQFFPLIEIPPKWILLEEVLKEIKADYDARVREERTSFVSGRVLLVVKDERMLTQIKDFLSSFRPSDSSSPFSSREAEETEESPDFSPPAAAPREGILHSRLRQFVTQQATFIRQSIGQSHQQKQQQKASSQRRNGKSVGQQKGGGGRGGVGLPGRERSGIVDSLLDEARSDSACVGVASKPITMRDFNQLNLDQQMMLALEKRLQINAVPIDFLGVPPSIPPPAAEAQGQKRSAPDSNSVPTAQSSKRQRRGSPATPAEGDREIEFQCSLLDPQFHIAIVTHSQCHHSSTLLTDHSPSYVILLDADIKTIRMIETYQAAPLTDPLKVYFLMYSESIEEHQYLSALKREKKAFEDLILKKATLVISLPDFVEPERETAEGEEGAGEGMVLSDSRLRRVSEKMKLSSVIVVDIREFGSSLPSSLHLHGVDIQPVTLAVGDYILAPQICVERKGISDLFQSFNSGRLFSQAESMMRHYELMCLLIEFSPQRPFCLQSTNEIPSEIQINNICSKIALLALAFPSLSILWSRSPHATIDIFLSLKKNFDNPDVARCLAIGNDETMTTESAACIDDLIPQDLLLSLPGINSNNFRAVMNNVTDIAQLSQMSVQQLTPLIGPINAKKLATFFKQTL